ncbi:TIGR02680 family protein [Streptomyces sp. NBC_00160]|uniref:TIGR02680 family protein n=1 Tax=Streptomyces sp. NBC_00160 TaxID=2903628 RepID=UPI0022522A0A|nr:TIGR02680 family protein [Streptomyces sp. NBC_00160]MCX5303010.1 TIGR02680 family protein [Streptomyces sp. NBC_00160]
MTPRAALPAPARTRWQPLRIGLVDLFHYDVEEFHFRDGRLLLRGNNGTGKSKVLALTLPFLLDGDLGARRVEPDGDAGKRMEWNLLLGGEHPHSERLGYTWVEFGRRDEVSGEEQFRTLVCGLKAVSGRGIARHWWAVTGQRIDHASAEVRSPGALSLLDATGTVLSRDRLIEAVAGHGMVYDQAKAYRRAVDEALFGLGEQRYAALVDLLIQLRQPQLSKRPNEAALSRALTEALPPMDQAVIADVAEAFRSLDEEKEELRAARAAEQAASGFLDHYRRYARVASRRRARLPRTEHSKYEHLLRDLAEGQAEKAAAEEERAAADERIAALAETRARLEAVDAALREGPEMRSAHELERAAKELERSAQDDRRARSDREEAALQHTKALGRLGAAENRLRAARDRAEDTLRLAQEAATAARLELPGDEGLTAAELRAAAAGATDRRGRTLAHVEELADRAEAAAAERRAAAVRLDETEGDLAHAAEAHGAAAEAVTAVGRALVDAVREHAGRCAELAYADPAGLLDELQEWIRHQDGPYPARRHGSRAHSAAAAVLADQAARSAQRGAALSARVRTAEQELTELEAGGRRGPQAPYTRTPGSRDQAAGAPLWRLVDFRDEVADHERAGLEAALEAAGLLDAWVRPDGAALTADGHDVLLDARRGPVEGPSLAEVLRPAVDHGDARAAQVGEETVGRIIRAVGLGAAAGDTGAGSAEAGAPSAATGPAGDTWAAPDGRYRVGVLMGRWAKPAAEYIGEGAREAARRTRITSLRAELSLLQQESESETAHAQDLAARRRTLDAELAEVPDDGPLTRAHARAAAAADTVRQARSRREARAAEARAAAERSQLASTELQEGAADLGLPPDRAELAAVRQALVELAAVLAALWPALRERSEAADQADEERAETGRAGERAAELALRAEETALEAAAADERLATLRSTVGEAVAELQRRLVGTAEALRGCTADQRSSQEHRTAADRRASRAEGRIEQLEKAVTEAAAARSEAIAALQRFTTTGLIAVALPELAVPAVGDGPWAATPAIALARSLESELSATDDSEAAWERVQRRLSEEHKTLQDALSRHGHSASARMVEDGVVVDIVYQGRERAVPELAEALAVEVGELTRILSAHEREILEAHLITEVAGTLQELIATAERQVLAMNAELEDRPTSTGMTLRLVWRASRKAPAGLAQARGRLLQTADAWTPEDRAAVGEFLQTQIARQQTEDAAGSWLEHLTAALDYRSWHEFAVERQQHGRWVPATGPASGGERVLAVSVPLFAAASSHYASAASPYAPRLVTLDEAFAGVDDDSRAKCLGLLHAFDLDVVMTSEREWACYPQVPGIAIAQLSRVDEVAAVLVTRWEWDGTARTRHEDPVRAADPETLWV